MTTQPDHVDATFYAIITPSWSRHRRDDRGRPLLEGASVDRITKGRPSTVRGDAVVTRLTLRIDSTALLPLQPQAVVHIHADDVQVIEVTADEPTEGDQP
ncbi:hypothetical protein KVF89_22540 [Nocardioides carbamazepini]|uniref:hypothetical protein n=1 Tax=Nocardioides carbamazepini TaxID=2854259 RepID=UPI00214A1859|nr:hypothetical protein [Nocardioides carbamazepini]MCR1785336.1 hypothetical protein [Nocardioides carbamazepini]